MMSERVETVPASELQIGDLIEFREWHSREWCRIEKIWVSGSGNTRFFHSHFRRGRITRRTCRASTLVERRVNNDE